LHGNQNLKPELFMKYSTSLFTALAVFFGSFAAVGSTSIFNQDFDGGYTGAFGTSQYFGGAPTNYANMVVSSGGNPNGAWTEMMTTTTWSDYYAGQLQLMTVSGNTDPTAANYVLSFDAYGSRAANMQIGFQSWQGNYFGGAQLINTTLNYALSAANTWQTFTVNLGTISGAVPTGATFQFNFQINSWEWGGPGNTDTLTIDNIVLTNVPEPSTFALAGLGLAALLIRRRK
jgi:hypothetical protein